MSERDHVTATIGLMKPYFYRSTLIILPPKFSKEISASSALPVCVDLWFAVVVQTYISINHIYDVYIPISTAPPGNVHLYVVPSFCAIGCCSFVVTYLCGK